MSECKPSEFAITRGKGFHIAFPSGYRVSVQFGEGNYCEKKYCCTEESEMLSVRRADGWSSTDAEVAIFGPDGVFVKLHEYDDVVGWQSSSGVLALLNWAANPEGPPPGRGE